jgi:GrpB-like predicted nucleotidyltransferase (UPF0157 family)
MRVEIVKYNPEWATIFNCIHCELNALLMDFKPEVEHIGSTSVPDLASKPIVDVLVGVKGAHNLDKVADSLSKHDYVYYEKLNSTMPYRRFFVKLKSKPGNLVVKKVYTKEDVIPKEITPYKLANIHVLETDSDQWIRHIALREYLKSNHAIRREYEELKIKLNTLDFWLDGHDYHQAKNTFIRQVEEEAVHWYCCALV